MSPLELPSSRSGLPPARIIWLIAAAIVILGFGRSICSWILSYFWWQEMGQVDTWLRMIGFRYLPGLAAWIVTFFALWLAHARGVMHAGVRMRDYPLYLRISLLLAAVLSLVIVLSTLDGWVIARYMGAREAAVPANTYHDPVFGKSLLFYICDLPFYNSIIEWLTAALFFAALAFYLTARVWQLRRLNPQAFLSQNIDLRDIFGRSQLESNLFKALAALFLIALAAQFFMGRYALLHSDHGNLLVGLDYIEQNIGLPLQMAKVAAALLAAVLVLAGRPKWALACAVIVVIDWLVPPLVSSTYVKPNELTLEKPYIQRHIEATRSAYGLDRRAREIDFPAQKEGRIDFAANRELLENVRLWDWRAFHDTLSQSQPLRPYTYVNTDVDRYMIDGKLRQTLLAPRELDLNQLGDARNRWINRVLTFTHGYGFALAEANRITESGLPVLLVHDAPAEVESKSLRVTRPEIYYGETSDEPVIVRTSQPEFNYPSGSSEVTTRYEGKGGFPIPSFGSRAVAAIAEGDWNILLTGALSPDSRMMIRRQVAERVSTLAPFLEWDEDPYLVSTEDGRLQWIVDGYVTSAAHPYSREIETTTQRSFNYIRNSVKATIDAYDGEVRMYVFDADDPLMQAYVHLFPKLFTPASQMPPGLRAHTRAPELLFRVQAEMYRTYHMRDPESYYNRADLWDLATFTTGSQGEPVPVPPTYLIAQLPGENKNEFLLTIPFTPRNKQNLIGMMVARSDGEHLGELVFLQLPKQEVIEGPLQVEALINQDQNISKDLTLWNQQGSQVLRSQVLTLPIGNTFLYVAPIYIQAAQARMPQLKKVALVRGSTLIYADTYEQALQQLQAVQGGKPVTLTTTAAPQIATPASSALAATDPRIDSVRAHLQRYRDLASQGKWSDAGKELEAIESVIRK